MKNFLVFLALSVFSPLVAMAQNTFLFDEMTYSFESKVSSQYGVLELRNRHDQSGLSIDAQLVSGNCRVRGVIALVEMEAISGLISGSLVTQFVNAGERADEISELRILTPENKTQEFSLSSSHKDKELRLSKGLQVKARLDSVVNMMRKIARCP